MSQHDDFDNAPNIPSNHKQQGYPVQNMSVSQDPRNTDVVTRILAANAVTQGTPYRRKIINHVCDPFTSATPELGMDVEFVYRVAQHIENRIAKVRILYFLIVITSPLFLFLSFIFVSPIITFFSRRILRNQYLGFFKPNSPTWNQAKHHFNIPNPPTPPTIPQPNQNAVVYKGFSPFVGAGVFIDGWSFPVDLGAYVDDLGNQVTPVSFTLAEIYGELTRNIQALGFEQVEIRDYLFTHGLDVMHNPLAFLPNTPEQSPMQILPFQAIGYYANNNDHNVRFYKWIRIYDWRGEVVFSFFLRFSFRGRNLFIEFNNFVLPPLKPDLSQVDYYQSAGLIGQVISSLNPIIPIVESLIFLNKATNWILSLVGLRTVDEIQQKLRDIRKDMHRGLPFNYGKIQSLREQFSHTDYTRFFQLMDKEMYTKIVQKEIIAYLGKFLASKKVNTTQFEERVKMIVNNGVMVGGNLEMSGGALAVGEGAKSRNIVNRAQATVKARSGQ